MVTRAEHSRINGRKGGRPRKVREARETREFPSLDSFPWPTPEDVPELTQDTQYDEYLSVIQTCGGWRSVWIRKPEVGLSGCGQTFQIADVEPRNFERILGEGRVL